MERRHAETRINPRRALLGAAALAASLIALQAHATINVISDQIVDGAGNPYQRPSGGNATLNDLGLGTVPLDSSVAVKVVPWSTLPGDVGQMQHRAGKLYFSTVQGQIWEYDLAGNRHPTPLLNVDALRPAFNLSGPTSGQGLRGFAFHPDFANNGLLYTTHREDVVGAATFDTAGGGTAIAHYALGEWNFNNLVDGNPSFRSVLSVAYPATDHVISQINFNSTAAPGTPDYGNLYVAFGDGGGAASGSNTTHNMFGYGQNMQALQASMIRINPRQSGPTAYTIPADNPFLAANDPTNAVRDEIYAKGFRNPTTMLFDQVTGALYSGDISQNTIEEVNLIQPGGNYGWGQFEGTWLHVDLTNTSATMRYIPLGDGSDVTAASATYAGKNAQGNPVTFTNINRLNDGFTSPFGQFSHEANQLDAANQSAAITGTVYRGIRAPALEGLYLFSSLSQDEIYFVNEADVVNDESPAPVRELQTLDVNGVPKNLWEIVGAPPMTQRVNHRFGQDANGDIYLISKQNDVIYRLESAGPLSIYGDLDLDGDVDGDDVADFVAGWLQTAPVGADSWRQGDLDLNGTTDLPDVHLMRTALAAQGLTFPSAAIFGADVPEPSAWTIAAATLTLGIRRKRKSPARSAGRLSCD